MFWADRIVGDIKNTKTAKEATKERPLVIRDEKTLSGRVHIGSMRGLAIHEVLNEVLATEDIPTHFFWEHNDFDPFDTVPGYLDQEKFKPYLGMPLYSVPSPEPGFPNYAEYFAAEFVAVHKKFGANPEYYWTYKDLYAAGKMDVCIRTALERVVDVRHILKEVSGSVKDESWLPVSVVCENCNKMMTTRAYDFDGETVAYTCDRSPDDCVPCGHTGRRSPFSGGAKLFWKVDWAAKWIAMVVDVEGGGKDHSTKGGARDVANHISREIFNRESPFDVPYEFFLVGGKKMSSSKGKGSSAKDMADLFPAEVLRLVLIGKDINQQIDVDPEGDSIPRMYDWYDELAEKVREGVSDDFTRLYELCQIPGRDISEVPWQLRFSQVAFMVQMPHLDIEKEAEAVKGSGLTETERRALAERADYARFWLNTYAPEEFRYTLQEELPEVSLSEGQQKAMAILSDYFTEPRSGEEVHARLHTLKDEVGLRPQELFSAIYQVFLARTSGPKAGWFLSGLPRDFVQKRFREASG